MYDQSYYESNAQDVDRPALWMYHRIWRRYCASGPVLEFGCGVGHLARRLSDSALTWGLEINPYAAQRTRINAPNVRLITSLDEMADGCVQSIVSLHVLEHITDEELSGVGNSFNRILRPGGRALFVMPDLGGRACALKGDSWMALRDPTHVNLKPAAEWVRLFERAWGWRVLRMAADGYYDYPYATDLAGRVLGDGLRIARTGAQFLAARMWLAPGDGEACMFLVEKPQ